MSVQPICHNFDDSSQEITVLHGCLPLEANALDQMEVVHGLPIHCWWDA